MKKLTFIEKFIRICIILGSIGLIMMLFSSCTKVYNKERSALIDNSITLYNDNGNMSLSVDIVKVLNIYSYTNIDIVFSDSSKIQFEFDELLGIHYNVSKQITEDEKILLNNYRILYINLYHISFKNKYKINIKDNSINAYNFIKDI